MLKRQIIGLITIILLVGAAAGSDREMQVAVLEEGSALLETLDSLWPGLGDSAYVKSEEDDPVCSVLNSLAAGAPEPEIGCRIAASFRAWFSAKVAESHLAAPVLSPEEAGFLLKALDAPKAKHARSAAREFTAARHSRLAGMKPETARMLRLREKTDGLALYTAYMALKTGRHREKPLTEEVSRLYPAFDYSMAPNLKHLLLDRLRLVAGGKTDSITPALSGFAQALVLDRTSHGWREQVLQEESGLDGLIVQ